MATYIVLNSYRAIMYAGMDQARVDKLLRPYPLNPGDALGEYAEKWVDGKPVQAWSRNKSPGWVDVDY